MKIEPLELRIAPAALVNPTTLTYTDLDGVPPAEVATTLEVH